MLKQEQEGQTNEQAPHSKHCLPMYSQVSFLTNPVVRRLTAREIQALFSTAIGSNSEIERSTTSIPALPGVRAGRGQTQLHGQSPARLASRLEEVGLAEVGQVDVVPFGARRGRCRCKRRNTGGTAATQVTDDEEHLPPVGPIKFIDEFLAEEEPVEAEEPGQVAGAQADEGLWPDKVLGHDFDFFFLAVVTIRKDALPMGKHGELGRIDRDGGVQADRRRVGRPVEEHVSRFRVDLRAVHFETAGKGRQETRDVGFGQEIHGHTFSSRTEMTASSPYSTASAWGMRKSGIIDPTK